MHKFLLAFLLAISVAAQAQVDRIDLSSAMFRTGDDNSWSLPSYNDNDWKKINCNDVWENQGYADYNGYAWYRFHFMMSSSIKNPLSGKIPFVFSWLKLMTQTRSILMAYSLQKMVLFLPIKKAITPCGARSVKFICPPTAPIFYGISKILFR